MQENIKVQSSDPNVIDFETISTIADNYLDTANVISRSDVVGKLRKTLKLGRSDRIDQQ